MINHLALNTLYFGILLSVIPFFLVIILFEKTNRSFLFAPLFVSMIFGVVPLHLTGVPYKTYKIGRDIIYFLLKSTVICFAIPLHKKREMLVKYWYHTTGGIGVGTVVALSITLAFARLAQFTNNVILSMLLQAATIAIALSMSAGTSGMKGLISLAVTLNGVIIYALGNKFPKLLQTTNSIAQGLVSETGGHILDVAPAKELGPVEESVVNIVLMLVGVAVVVVVSAFAVIFF